ncbi:hypothetical protein [Pseudooctadecabacter jejudonensis]|uniref:Uncharacterized protein n=1 Tax=Pseudooctadecabacter jejudonensis TaxID=1391910 RepID=A0A1Y5T2C1_9RHOB|nr:hypothetical protein [Pseudooctadecabacter jejudonensis]SLN54372.1 hypothetical protein PSJ8397_02842 [Pseudooctadecabacter jejudonensis]
MKLIPSKKQWLNWSLPSKATYIGTLAGVLSLLVAVLQTGALQRGWAYLTETSPPSFSFEDANPNIVDEVTADLSEKVMFDFNDHRSITLKRVFQHMDLCWPDGYNTDIDRDYWVTSQLLVLRMMAINSVFNSDAYRIDDFDRHRNHGLEVGLVALRDLDVSQFRQAFEVFRYYRDTITLHENYEARLSQASDILIAGDPQFASFDEGTRTRFVQIKNVLGIAPYPSPCFHAALYSVSLEDWIVSFWVRRHAEGNFHLASWLLDQALAQTANRDLIAPTPITQLRARYDSAL